MEFKAAYVQFQAYQYIFLSPLHWYLGSRLLSDGQFAETGKLLHHSQGYNDPSSSGSLGDGEPKKTSVCDMYGCKLELGINFVTD